jgi:leucyl aminopeptidase (aminopeptidase T)
MSDDGQIDSRDIESGAIVSNLPAGSVYTTVTETASTGSIRLAGAANGKDVVLNFRDGRADDTDEYMRRLFRGHSGEPARISHIGIGLNPYLKKRLGWTVVDEHIHGCLFLALGENRYMGGENASSLNVDFIVPDATLIAGSRTIVESGVVVV